MIEGNGKNQQKVDNSTAYHLTHKSKPILPLGIDKIFYSDSPI